MTSLKGSIVEIWRGDVSYSFGTELSFHAGSLVLRNCREEKAFIFMNIFTFSIFQAPDFVQRQS